MNKKLAITVLLSILSMQSFAQEKQSIVKKGWTFGGLPSLSYSTDSGFQYGICGNLYYYGDGTNYPRYQHMISFEASHFTRGTTRLHLLFDTRAIDKFRIISALSYYDVPMAQLYGFNGSATPYDPHLDANLTYFAPDLGISYYSYYKRFFRALTDVRYQIGRDLNLCFGFTYYAFGAKPMQKPQYKYGATIYDDYVKYGLIRPDEAEGGNHLELKAGFSYDSRNHDSAPSKGMWADAFLLGSPALGSNYKYLQLNLHFRHYVPVPNEKFVFAYHLGFQGTISGEAPFYINQNISTVFLRNMISEGLGGCCTVRGILYDRMLGSSYAWANTEFRIRLFRFNLLNQSFYVATSPLFDMGAIVKPYRLDDMLKLPENSSKTIADLQKAATVLHTSAGLGFSLVMNENFVLIAEGAHPFRKEDGTLGINLGVNYTF